MNTKTGYGFGKTILFGEHFVVYGLPAIVCALNCKTIASIKKNENLKNDFELIDNRPKVSTFKKSKTDSYKSLVKNILDFAKIKEKLEITLSGDLVVTSGGIGASAATAAAISRALNNCFKLGWDEQGITEAAFIGEKGVHGSPSGIDNTAAVLGGVLLFKKNKKIEEIKLKQKVEIVLIDSGISSDTKKVLEEVKKIKEKESNKFNDIFDEYSNLVKQAKESLLNFDLKEVGQLMNKNHELLKKINVSCTKLDEIVELAKKEGAFGAKLTGTGCGGLVVALTPGKVLQEKVANFFEKNNYFVLKTSIG